MKLISGYVLLKVTAEEKKKVFEQQVGDDILFKALPAGADMAESYNQSVHSALVVAVAKDVKHILPGDIAIVDYLLDTLTENIVHEDDTGKWLVVDSRTFFHDEDKLVYASLKTRNDMYVWRKGDVDTSSLIYGVFRDDKLIPNPPYVFVEHKDFRISRKTEMGIVYEEQDQDVVIRRVLVPNAESDPELQPGTLIFVSFTSLFERSFDGKMIDVIMDGDVELAIE